MDKLFIYLSFFVLNATNLNVVVPLQIQIWRDLNTKEEFMKKDSIEEAQAKNN